MRATFVTLAALATLLAACSKKPAAPAADQAAAPAAATAPATPAPAAPAVAAGPAGPITAAEMPAPRAGEWTRVSTQDTEAPTTSTKCLDGKPIDPMEGIPGKCARMDLARTAAGGYTVDADCPANGVEARLTMAISGDYQSTFTTDSTMTMSGGPGGAMTLKNHSVWTYKGACPAK